MLYREWHIIFKTKKLYFEQLKKFKEMLMGLILKSAETTTIQKIFKNSKAFGSLQNIFVFQFMMFKNFKYVVVTKEN